MNNMGWIVRSVKTNSARILDFDSQQSLMKEIKVPQIKVTRQGEDRIKPRAVSLAVKSYGVNHMPIAVCRFELKYNNENRS